LGTLGAVHTSLPGLPPRGGRRAGGNIRHVELQRWVGRELHDGAAQILAGVIIQIEQLKAEQYGRQGVLAELGDIQDLTREALKSLRNMLSQMGQQPVFEASFITSLEALVERIEHDTGIEGAVIVEDWPEHLNAVAATNLYRIVEHAVRNAVLHSDATRITITLRGGLDYATVQVEDNGAGIVMGGDRIDGYGIRGMRERAVLLGADLTWKSAAAVGTIVLVSIPVGALL
jgi:two-component system sensor histidine kinase UhpB